MNSNHSNGTQEQLRFLYTRSLELLINETRLISERTNIFLVFNSIFFAAFVLMKTQIEIQSDWVFLGTLVISTAGLIFCFLFYFLIRSAVNAANNWRGKIRKIEQNENFWQGTCDPAEYGIFQSPPNQKHISWPPVILGKILPALIISIWIASFAWTIFSELGISIFVQPE